MGGRGADFGGKGGGQLDVITRLSALSEQSVWLRDETWPEQVSSGFDQALSIRLSPALSISSGLEETKPGRSCLARSAVR